MICCFSLKSCQPELVEGGLKTIAASSCKEPGFDKRSLTVFSPAVKNNSPQKNITSINEGHHMELQYGF